MSDRTHFKTSGANNIRDSVSFGDVKPLDKIMQDVTVIKDIRKDSNASHDDINHLIKNAENILILADGIPNDAAGASVALALYIKSKFDKNVDLIFLGDLESVSDELKNLYEIKPALEKVVLKIELDYKETEIESCEWYKDEENKKLVFEIKPIHKGFGTKRIKFKEDGLDYDLIITLGLSDLTAIGEVYKGNEHYFSSVDVVSFNNSNIAVESAKTNILDPDSEFLTKIIFDQFIEWKFVPGIDISRSLLLGLSAKQD